MGKKSQRKKPRKPTEHLAFKLMVLSLAALPAYTIARLFVPLSAAMLVGFFLINASYIFPVFWVFEAKIYPAHPKILAYAHILSFSVTLSVLIIACSHG